MMMSMLLMLLMSVFNLFKNTALLDWRLFISIVDLKQHYHVALDFDWYSTTYGSVRVESSESRRFEVELSRMSRVNREES